jgi:hypothetical protein
MGTIQAYISLVPTGGSMGTGNAWLWNIQIGASGALSITEPQFFGQGDRFQASGSAVGLVAHTSFLRYP